MTIAVAVTGLMLIGLLGALQAIAVVRPRDEWTIENVYGGDPSATDPVAYFAVNQGYAWADAVFWTPIQIAASVGMLLGERWGFLLGLVASAPFWYTAITLFVWDRDLGFRRPTAGYWIVWGVFPVYGVVEGVYCFVRLV
jgi:hypothetical protein